MIATPSTRNLQIPKSYNILLHKTFEGTVDEGIPVSPRVPEKLQVEASKFSMVRGFSFSLKALSALALVSGLWLPPTPNP